MENSVTSSGVERTRQQSLNEQAVGWLLTLEGHCTRETEARFHRWLESSADHIQAFLEVTAVDRDLDAIDPERQIDLETLILDVCSKGASSIVMLEKSATTPDSPAPKHLSRWNMGLAAAVATLVILSGLFFWTRPAPTASHYMTAIGEQRALKLEDGSLLHLNTRSHIEIDFTGQTRDVRLLAGEALFNVKHDTARPFRVHTGSALVQAVGTQFNVYRHENATTVSVVEGSVKITRDENSGARNGSLPVHLMLAAGEEARIGSDGHAVKRTGAKVDKAIAWRQRQLDFDRTTLAYAVEQFNRYNEIQIRIADPELGLREIDGVFNADQPQALLDFLSQERTIWFERKTDAIIIHARPAAQS